MSKRTKKIILVSGKVLLAVVLLAWVLSRVHWADYVQTPAGETYSVLERIPEQGPAEAFVVRTGWRGPVERRPAEDFEPVADGQYLRPGFAGTIDPQRVNRVLLAVAILAWGVSLPISAWRLSFLLGVQQIRVRWWELLRLTFLGQFFNAVVPGMVGGDLVKAWYVARHTPRKVAVLVTVVVDRFAGLAELTLLAAVMLLVVWAGGLEEEAALWLPAMSVLAVLVGGGLFYLFLTSQRLRGAMRLDRLYGRLPIVTFMQAAGESATLFRRRPWAIPAAIGITVISHVFFIGSMLLMGLALGLPIPLHAYVLYLPVIYIIAAVPLTPGGIGLVEHFYVLFLAAGLATPSQVLALALLARLTPILWGLPGLGVALRGPKLPPSEAMQAQMGIGRAGDAA